MRTTFTFVIGPNMDQRRSFDKDRVTIGRADDNDLSFGDSQRRVSAHHAELIRAGDTYLLRDLGSTNGTLINGRRVVTSELNHDDLVEFGAGGPLLRFAVEQPPPGSLSNATVNRQSGFADKTTTRLVAAQPKPGNALLIAAIIVSMLLGAFGGAMVSRRARPNQYSFNYAEVYEASKDSVVFVRVEYEWVDPADNVVSTETRTGTGFIVSADGLIVTNRHVVRAWEYDQPSGGSKSRVKSIQLVRTGYLAEDVLDAEVFRLSRSKETDVALLKITAPDLKPLQLARGESAEADPGDAVAIIGYPLGLDPLRRSNEHTIEPALSPGVVNRVGSEAIQVTLRAFRGNSGGPVLTRNGQVIGILTANIGDGSIALCTPIGAAIDLIK